MTNITAMVINVRKGPLLGDIEFSIPLYLAEHCVQPQKITLLGSWSQVDRIAGPGPKEGLDKEFPAKNNQNFRFLFAVACARVQFVTPISRFWRR
jgi:hypothetical protein